jgi:DNA polymerase III epsilon subunit-like protein
MITFNYNVLAAYDVETTGETPGYHEIVQCAIVPLDRNLDPMDVSPFNMMMRPDHPERAVKDAMRCHGISMERLMIHPDKAQVADCLHEWFRSLKLPFDKRLISLTQNGLFDVPFMKAWLGERSYHDYFCFNGRDTMQYALSLNDTAAWKNQPIPFNGVGLKPLAKRLGVVLDNHHDALADALACARVYREMLRMEL